MMEKGADKERYIATLLGCAIGDALGMPIEHWTPKEIARVYGRIEYMVLPELVKRENGAIRRVDPDKGIFHHTGNTERGEYTDDTILTLAIAESIVRSKSLDVFDMAKSQMEAYDALTLPDGTIRGGLGWTTADAFANLKKGLSPLESGVIGSPGNAPAMKLSPIGLYMHATDDYEKGIEAAKFAGKTTHLDPRSIASGVVQAYAAYFVLHDHASRGEFIEAVYDICSTHEQPADERFKRPERTLTERLGWIKDNRDASVEDAFARLGSSSKVWSSYPFALFMFQKYYDNPIEGLLETVNLGGDCDTTGAMFGVLAGARHGMFFKQSWLDDLKGKERIIKAAEGIYSLGDASGGGQR